MAKANLFFGSNIFWLSQQKVSIGCRGDTGSVVVPSDLTLKLCRTEKDQSVLSRFGSSKICVSLDLKQKRV